MAISKWESLKAYEPAINFWLQFNPTFLVKETLSLFVHKIFSNSTPFVHDPNKLTLSQCWEKLTTASTAIQQIASKNGLHQRYFEQSPDLFNIHANVSFDSFDQIFEHVQKTLFDPQKYRENLIAGKAALQDSSFKQAKTSFADCLKAAQGANLACERDAAVCLAETYVQEAQIAGGKNGKKKLIKAAGLLNYVLNIAKKEKNPQASKPIWARLNVVEEILFSLLQKPFSKGVEKVLFSLFQNPQFCDKSCHEKNRSTLRAIRSEIEQKMPRDSSSIASIQEILEFTTAKMKAFSAELLDQALLSLGGAPCKYAMIGFGSLARGEMAPYSDLDFAFLIEDEKHTPFFRDLTYLLHFKVLYLGETILPALGIPTLSGFNDCITARGFAFDGAGVVGKGHKTPLGHPGSFELIHTPQEMAAFQGKKTGSDQYWFELEPFLPMELQQYTWISGNDDTQLTKDYGTALDEILEEPYKDTTLRDYMSRKLLFQEDLDTFIPDMQFSGTVINVKKELYRLPHLFLQRLCLLHRIKEESSWQKIESLESKGLIKPKVAERFKELFAITMWYRLTTYMHFKAQNENKNPLVLQALNEPQSQEQQGLAGDFKNSPQITHLYSILIPMTEMMYRFSEGKVLDEQDLYDCSDETVGGISFRLMQDKKAKRHLALAIKDQPKNLPTLFNFSKVLFNINEYKEALDIINPLLETFESNGSEKINQDIAYCYFLRGKIYKQMGRVREALHIYQQLSVEFTPVSTKGKFLTYNINLDLGEIYKEFGNMPEAKKYYSAANKIARESLSESPYIIAESLLLSGKISFEQEDYDIAIDYFRRALVIHREFLSDTHPNNFLCLEGLCGGYRRKKDFMSAIALAKYCLKKLLQVHASNLTREIDVLVSSFSRELGLAYMDLGDEKKSQNFKLEAQKNYVEALDIFEKNLLIDKQTFGEMHANVGDCLTHLGRAYEGIGNFKKSITCFDEAVKILNISPEDHPSQLIYALRSLGDGLVYKAGLNPNRESKTLMERALRCIKYSHKLSKKHLPHRSDFIAADLMALALIYGLLENVKESKKKLLLAVKETEKLPEDHPVRLDIRKNYLVFSACSDF